MSGLGIGRMNGGWSRVVGVGGAWFGEGELSSPIFGICAVSALWSLYSVLVVVVVACS